jgi:tRNA modification GTPase
VNDLIMAQSNQAAQLAINTMSGSLKAVLETLMDDVLAMIAHIEVNIDYPEYDDVHQLTTNEIYPKTTEWIKEANRLLQLSNDGQMIKEGIKTVILGKPNVGKSSLLNALLNEEKAIVTPIAGTTRDLVEGWVRLKNIPLHLIDTAGIQASEDLVEQIGIKRTLASIESADLVILVLDASEKQDEKDNTLLDLTQGKQRIIVYNKSDLVKQEDVLQISALNKDIHPLIEEIEAKFAKNLLALNETVLHNQRQIGLFTLAKNHMVAAKEAIDQGFETDMITIDLQLAYDALETILRGQEKTKLIDEIFKRFCLGK